MCARAVDAQLFLSISGPLVFSVSVAEMKIELDTGRNDELQVKFFHRRLT